MPYKIFPIYKVVSFCYEDDKGRVHAVDVRQPTALDVRPIGIALSASMIAQQDILKEHGSNRAKHEADCIEAVRAVFKA